MSFQPRSVLANGVAWAAATGWALCAILQCPVFAAPAANGGAIVRQVAELENKNIRESSGLAASRRHAGMFWTHNDSGDDPRVFAFDASGKHLGTAKLQGAKAIDWEDMGTFTLEGKHYLFVADTGDNDLRRTSRTIYWGLEPENPKKDIAAAAIPFRFEDGPHDCEAVAYDPARREFILIEKRLATTSRVYIMPWTPGAPGETAVARAIGTIPVLFVTGMGISPDGLRAVVATGSNGYQLTRRPDEDWSRAMARPGHPLKLPVRRQGESICFGLDGVTLYLTSEKRPCPLFSITGAVAENRVQSEARPATVPASGR
jgi:hypothetical protein